MNRLLISILLLSAVLSACATPSETFTKRAERAGLAQDVVMGDLFRHRIYWNEGARKMVAAQNVAVSERTGPRRLHVYLGGDGVPWRAGHPTVDPTPRNPLMLRLIALDPNPAVFLGRPCFHGFSEEAPCDWPYWNDARYSEPIVASMSAALAQVIERTDADSLVLFGASGGGALAVLISDRIDGIDGIVTVAANLDTRAWLSYHAYDGLKESLNPARDGRTDPERNAKIFERHYAGEKDVVVPPRTMTAGLRSPDELIVVPNYDHNCCWHEIWSHVLADVDRLNQAVPAASSEVAPPGS